MNAGSPPRLRGLQSKRRRKTQQSGITPASAGTTSTPSSSAGPRQDHPRVCGDYPWYPRLRSSLRGSPPRLRGLLAITPDAELVARITPASAGTTQLMRMSSTLCKDHPRVCGDYKLTATASSGYVGSPPRLRGLRSIGIHELEGSGITPASAGTTAITIPDTSFFEDHPRVCGDYKHHSAPARSSRGSPPRLRGLLLRPDVGKIVIRITPASAGTTQYPPLLYSRSRDHPRVCGDYYKLCSYALMENGSPPRLRGLRVVGPGADGLGGITPASAGTTACSLLLCLGIGDHPRVCGDYCISPCGSLPI